MSTETITYSAENWTGREITKKIHRNDELYAKIRYTTQLDNKLVLIEVDRDGWEEADRAVGHFDNTRVTGYRPAGSDWTFEAYGVARSDPNPAVAFLKLLHNIY